jgi:oligopeptidase B
MPSPPVAPRRPTRLTGPGGDRVDDWYWLRDRNDPATLAYLEAENAYAAAELAAHRELVDRCFAEIRSRVLETDVSAPVRWGPWEYFTRTDEHLQHPRHGRRPRGSPPGRDETLFLDENELAGGTGFVSLGVLVPAPDHSVVAWSLDTDGSERHTLRFRVPDRGVDLPDAVPEVAAGGVFVTPERFWYLRLDETMRPAEVWEHRLGTPASSDRPVHVEEDRHFHLSLQRSRSGRMVFVHAAAKDTTEVRWCPTDDPEGTLTPVTARREGLHLEVDHRDGAGGGVFVVAANLDDAEDGEVWLAAPGDADPARWAPLLGHRPGVRVVGVDAFAAHLLVTERERATTRVRVIDLDHGRDRVVGDDELGVTWVGPSPEYGSGVARLRHTSLVDPLTDLDLELATGRTTVVKETPVPGYERGRYRTERLWATAADGVAVPVTLARRADVRPDGTAPLLCLAYGAYEISYDPAFSPARLSLLDRGFVVAIVHARGGGELGRAWYEAGRRRHKRNTFTDAIAGIEHLHRRGWSAPDRTALRGGSAGGLTVGAVVTMRPDLCRAAVAEVPFVDVVTTMSDETLPLTVTEWDEWGNPRDDPDDERYMRSYSPYDNVRPLRYPALFVTAGLHDPRVAYWEPAKWVAKLRATGIGDRRVLLRTEMGAGHHGPTARHAAWRDEAEILAFLISELGAPEQPLP